MSQVDYEINKELGECYLHMSDYDKAHQYYHKAIKNCKENAAPYMGLAAIALAQGNLEEALALYTKANSLEKTDKSHAGMGMVATELGRHEEGFVSFGKALELNPVNMIALNGVVQLGYFMNRLEEIIDFLKKALKAQDDEVIRYTLAGCLLAVGKEEESRKNLEILLGVNPQNEAAQQLYAFFAA